MLILGPSIELLHEGVHAAMARGFNGDIGLFLGAGASAHVGLPTVCQFFKHVRFPPNLFQAGCEKVARDVAARQGTTGAIHLDESDAEMLFGRLADIVRADPTGVVTLDQGPKVPAGDLLIFLRRELVRIYGETAGLLPLLRPHAELLRFLNEAQPQRRPLVVFTTNYDRLIEAILASELGANMAFAPLIPVLRSGFTTARPGSWNPAELDILPEPQHRTVHLIKLHGSVTWKWQQVGGHRVPVETGWPESADEKDCVLHFGYKEIPEEDPFKTLHDKLEDTLRGAGPCLMVCIGFRFGDQVIRKAFYSALRANAQFRTILCLTRVPDYGTPLGKLMDEFPQQLLLLRDPNGKPIPFGSDGFVEALKSAVETAFHD